MGSIQIEAAGYVGRQHKAGFAGFDADMSSFCLLEVEEGNPESAEQFFTAFRNRAADDISSNNQTVKSLVDAQLAEAGIASPMAAAVGVVADDRLHIYCIGQGKVYLYRNGTFITLISGDHTAVGAPEEGDIFVFANEAFHEAVGGDETVNQLMSTGDVASPIAAYSNAHKVSASCGCGCNLGSFFEVDRSRGDVYSC